MRPPRDYPRIDRRHPRSIRMAMSCIVVTNMILIAASMAVGYYWGSC